MLVEIGVGFASLIVLMILTNIVGGLLGTSFRQGIVMQVVFAGAGAAVLLEFSLIGMPIAFGVLLGPLGINGLSMWLNRRQKKRAMSGVYGEEVKWAAELVDDGDEYFAFVISQMPQTELKEVGIIAESKEELRDLTIERFEEQAESIPQDFAQ